MDGQPSTLRVKKAMQRFPIISEMDDGAPAFTISKDQSFKSCHPGPFWWEGDASSVVAGTVITVHGCGTESVQGDVEFANVMEPMSASVMWAPDNITITRDVAVTPKLKARYCGKFNRSVRAWY